MTTLYLVRHADAGERNGFDGPDQRRPLNERGRLQAVGLRDALAGTRIARLLASPYLRCQQTLQPLAGHLGLDVEVSEHLTEGAGALGALELAADLRGAPAAFCSHGDVVPDILEELHRRGIELLDELRWQKASVWVLEWDGDRLATGRYLPPPRT
jgi:8-oxo-dGTP diphosphatase